MPEISKPPIAENSQMPLTEDQQNARPAWEAAFALWQDRGGLDTLYQGTRAKRAKRRDHLKVEFSRENPELDNSTNI